MVPAEQFGDLILTPQASGRKWELRRAFTYTTDAGELVSVPAGFVTDLASVPRALWWLYPPFGRYTRAAVIHDWLYREGRIGRRPITRAEADEIFRQAMLDGKVPAYRARILWAAVRVGAGGTWARYRRAQ